MPNQPERLTLSEVSKRTKISMPTLQRYKKEYQRRIPSVGKGRKQRYPVEALEVFQAIKTKNLAKRGRPRKGRAAKTAGRKVTATAKPTSGLLTLKEIGKRTGIAYATLLRYVKTNLAQIPYESQGRKRRYHREAVEVFKELRAQSGGRGRSGRKTAGRRRVATSTAGNLAQRVKALEQAQAGLERQINDLIRELRKPFTLTVDRGR